MKNDGQQINQRKLENDDIRMKKLTKIDLILF